VIRNGRVVTDATFYPYDGATVHDVASVTKSVMTTLIGIAAGQGKLNLDDPMVSFFPERTIANLDEAKEAITVRHLTGMASGLDCVRDGAPGASNPQMQSSPDFVQFALDRPVAWEPGSQFVYCSPAIHLLSPILKQATGMPALDFARQYLFEPLGIRDAQWEQDPQGYYDGWGDLSLHPRDMAKIGYLFLNKGRWDGEQIVPEEWVEEATVAQTPVAADEDPYGYGWWVNSDIEGSYRADGRGGQYVIVLPEWDMLVVTTGGGFSIDQIGEYLLASIVDLENPLPANPEGEARLADALSAVAQPPTAEPVAPLPEIARAVSGRTYILEPNVVGLDSFACSFEEPAEASCAVGVGGQAPLAWAVGLDGVYRFSPGLDGRPLGARGAWVDEDTFMMESNGITTNDQFTLSFTFAGDKVEVQFQEKYGGSARIEGQAD
jgi:CubicO group peptidase (beta-lactamase class C family)